MAVGIDPGTTEFIDGDGVGTPGDPHKIKLAADKAEDTNHTTGAVGRFVLGVRQDAEASPVDADGDYQGFLFDGQGRLRTRDTLGATAAGQLADNHNVTVSNQPADPATQTTLAAILAGQLADGHNVAVSNLPLLTEDVAGVGGEEGFYLLARRQDVDAVNSVDADGDFIGLTTDQFGALRVSIKIGGTNPALGDGAVTGSSLRMTLADSFTADFDSGAGTVIGRMVGIGIPGAGGMVPGGTAANPLEVTGVVSGATEFTEDAVGAGGEAGPFVIGRRQDADSSPVDADGDYHGFLFDALGNLKVRTRAVFAEDAIHTTGDPGFHMLGVRRDANTTPVDADGDYHSIIYDAFGAAKVALRIAGVPVSTGLGGADTGTVRVALATDQGTIKVANTPQSGGGWDKASFGNLNSTGQVVKASAGSVGGVMVSNGSATAYWLKFYDKATAPLSTDTPEIRPIYIPAQTSGWIALPSGIRGFDSGIGVRATAGVADADAANPTTDAAQVTILYV